MAFVEDNILDGDLEEVYADSKIFDVKRFEVHEQVLEFVLDPKLNN